MSFQVKYIYDLVDNISPAIKKISANMNNLDNSTRKLSPSFQKIQQNIAKTGTQLSNTGKEYFLKTSVPLSLLGGRFIKVASDYQESLNKVEVAFGSASNSVKAFADTAGKKFGIDKSSALDMASQFGDMATSMGISQANASSLATSLVGLAGDLNSFKNLKGDMAKTALNAIFTGETESLKMLGVVMTEANLKQYALSHGITKKIEKMRQDEKVMLRYNYVMAMTKNAHGDFQRTISGFANQIRVLNDNFNSLSITFGTILLPYANKAIGVAIELLEKFQQLSPATQEMALMFAGIAIALPPVLFILGSITSLFAKIFFVASKLAPVLFLVVARLGMFMALNPMLTLVAGGVYLVYKYFTELSDIVNTVYNKIVKLIKFLANLGGSLANKIAIKLGFDPVFSQNALNSLLEPKIQPVEFQQATNALTGGINVNFANTPKQTVINSNASPNLNLGINTTYAR